MNDTLIAAIVLEAQSITKDMKKAFEMRSDSLEARIRVLEDKNVREFTVGNAESAYVNAQNGFGDAVLKVEMSLADTLKIPEKRGRGRPKKGS